LVKVAGLPQLPIGLVDGIEQVDEDDKYMDTFSVSDECTRPWLRLGFACSYPDGIVCSLYPARDKLSQVRL